MTGDPLQEGVIQVGSLQLHHWVGGPPGAPDVILVHGWVVAGWYFLPLARILARRFRVWVPELPNHGDSEPCEDPLEIEDEARILSGWMTAVGIRRASLVGNSMGCQVAVELARQQPDRVEQLVLIGPTSATRGPLKGLGRLLLTSVFEPLHLVLGVAFRVLRFGIPAAIRLAFCLLDHRLDQRIGGLAHPVLLLRGRRDHVAPRAFLQALARRLPHSLVIELPQAAHAPHYEDPEATGRLIESFLVTASARPCGTAARTGSASSPFAGR